MGDTPAAAVGDLLGSLQRALSCVSPRVLVATGRRPGVGSENVLPAGVEPVALAAPGPLALRLGLRYELRPPEAGELRWRAPVVSYFFVLEDEGARELFAFHWHPVGQSAVSWPHVHVGPATGARVRPTPRRTCRRAARSRWRRCCASASSISACGPGGRTGSRCWQRRSPPVTAHDADHLPTDIKLVAEPGRALVRRADIRSWVQAAEEAAGPRERPRSPDVVARLLAERGFWSLSQAGQLEQIGATPPRAGGRSRPRRRSPGRRPSSG